MSTIKHEAFVNLYNKNQNIFDELFKETKTLKDLTKKISKLSLTYKQLAYSEKEGSNKVKGDLFEIFAECFLNIFSAHPRIGVYDYRPGPAVDDYGVDGYGVGMDNNPCTVQVKFRQNITSELVLDDIKNFEGFSYRNYKVPVDTTTNLIFFTNAKGLNFITEAKVLSGASRTIGNKLIRELVDNNNVFWKEVLEMVELTIKEKYN